MCITILSNAYSSLFHNTFDFYRKSFYLPNYTEVNAINEELICKESITTGNGRYLIKTEAIFADYNLQGAWLYYKGANVGQLTPNINEKTFTISIGVFWQVIKMKKGKYRLR